MSRDLSGRLIAKLASPYSPGSLGARARLRRWEELARRFPDIGDMNVVDLGGDTRDWRAAPIRPRHVTIVDEADWALQEPEPWMTPVRGDACDRATIDGSFDLAFSNSVLEHVGGPYRRGRFAEVVESLAPHHWVQTPYRYFPLEPHWLFPGFQFLPVATKAELSQRWPLSPWRGRSTVDFVMSVELVTLTEMRTLFPQSEILRERAAGLVKSLIAVR